MQAGDDRAVHDFSQPGAVPADDESGSTVLPHRSSQPLGHGARCHVDVEAPHLCDQVPVLGVGFRSPVGHPVVKTDVDDQQVGIVLERPFAGAPNDVLAPAGV